MKRDIILVHETVGPVSSLVDRLEKNGFAVRCLSSALEGLRHIEAACQRQAPPSAIVTGDTLHHLTGLDFVRVLKSRYPDLPVWYLAGDIPGLYPEHPEARLVQKVFPHPFDPGVVTTTLSTFPGPGETRTPAHDAPTRTVAGAFALLRLADGAAAREVFDHLAAHPAVRSCEAVVGAFDLLAHFQGKTPAEVKRAFETTRQGQPLAEAVFLPIQAPPVDAGLTPFLQSWRRQLVKAGEGSSTRSGATMLSELLLVEATREGLPEAFSRLAFTENVVACDAVKGDLSLLLRVRSPHAEETQRIVRERIKPIPAILRLRSLKIVRSGEN